MKEKTKIIGYQLCCYNKGCSGPEVWGWHAGEALPAKDYPCPTCGWLAKLGDGIKPIIEEFDVTIERGLIMFILDGSSKDYADITKRRKNVFAWGWLVCGWEDSDRIETVATALCDSDTISKIIDKIKNIEEQFIVDLYCGQHTCDMCGESDSSFNGSIKILYNGKVYICPAGVYHYIALHNYIPPKEVIDAIFHGTYLTEEMMMSPEFLKLYEQEK